MRQNLRPSTVRPRRHLGPAHPLAEVAGRWCAAHWGGSRRAGVGQVACGACWERAIRDDERIAVEFGLPRELVPDPAYVDEVAVELACAGERVAVTPVERALAVRQLGGRGLTMTGIADRLGVGIETVRAVLSGLAAAVPLAPVAEFISEPADAGEAVA